MSLELSTPQSALESPIQLPSYYNPGIINANRYAEQQQKRKLLWGSKKNEDSANKWGNAHFSQDSDGKVASKFMRLMGIKHAPASMGGEAEAHAQEAGGSEGAGSNGSATAEGAGAVAGCAGPPGGGAGGGGGGGGAGGGAVAGAGAGAPTNVPADVQLRQRMFSNMEQQYEMARAATHTMRGVGLGFGSQPRTF